MLTRVIVVGLAVTSLSGNAALATDNEWRPRVESLMGLPEIIRFGNTAYKEIQIESNPTDAVIWIDGRRFGTTPQVIRVDDQRRTIYVVLRKPGYLDIVRKLDLAKITDPVTHADLMPRQ